MALAKAMGQYLSPRIDVRSVKASVLPKHVRFLKFTSLVVRSRFSVIQYPVNYAQKA